MYDSSLFVVHFIKLFSPDVSEINASVDDTTWLTHNVAIAFYEIYTTVSQSITNRSYSSQCGVTWVARFVCPTSCNKNPYISIWDLSKTFSRGYSGTTITKIKFIRQYLLSVLKMFNLIEILLVISETSDAHTTLQFVWRVHEKRKNV
jgi:hypothetical protein